MRITSKEYNLSTSVSVIYLKGNLELGRSFGFAVLNVFVYSVGFSSMYVLGSG